MRDVFSGSGKCRKEEEFYSPCSEQTLDARQTSDGDSSTYICGTFLEQWSAYHPKRSEVFRFIPPDQKTGGLMLSVTGINHFYYLRGFTDCVVSIPVCYLSVNSCTVGLLTSCF